MIFVIGTGSHSEQVHSILCLTYPEDDIKFVSFPEGDGSLPSELSEIVSSNFAGVISKEFLDENIGAKLIVGIGDNFKRKRVVDALTSMTENIHWVNAVHPNAIFTGNVSIGNGNVICANATLNTGVRIGDHNILNTASIIEHHGVIRDYVHLAPNVACCGNVYVGEGALIGVGACVLPNARVRPWSLRKAHTTVNDKEGSLIPIYEPNQKWFGVSAMEALQSGWISSIGPYLSKSKENLESILGKSANVLLVNNGTSATHCLFLALQHFHPEVSRIYVPNHVYVAVWNAALYVYPEESIRVIPTDPDTWNMNVSEEMLASLEPNSALVLVHNLGNLLSVERIHRIRPDIILLEDNCEGFMGRWEESNHFSPHVLCSAVSFYGNKNVTTGEGGAVYTPRSDVWEFLHKTSHQGYSSERYVHDVIGYNYRMTNIQAALLYDQLQHWEEIRSSKKRIFDFYKLQFESCPNIVFPMVESGVEPSNWMVAVRILGSPGYLRARHFFALNDVDSRPFFYPYQRHNHLRNLIPHCPACPEVIAQTEIVMLPSYPTLTNLEMLHIVEVVKRYIREECLAA